jgi:hypothetical protein
MTLPHRTEDILHRIEEIDASIRRLKGTGLTWTMDALGDAYALDYERARLEDELRRQS